MFYVIITASPIVMLAQCRPCPGLADESRSAAPSRRAGDNDGTLDCAMSKGDRFPGRPARRQASRKITSKEVSSSGDNERTGSKLLVARIARNRRCESPARSAAQQLCRRSDPMSAPAKSIGEIQWSQPATKGDKPAPRSGHTITVRALRSVAPALTRIRSGAMCVPYPLVAAISACRWLETRPLSSGAAESRRAMSHAYPTKHTTCTWAPIP